MNTWAPIFSKIVDSSVWMEADHVRIVFVTMLAKKDADHVVRATAYMIGQWAKKTEAETLDALKILSSPDTMRIEPQPFEGRRIEKVDGGWKILNGQVYQDLMRSINRKVYKAEHEKQRRQDRKLNGGSEQQAEVIYGHYPKKVGKPKALKAIREAVRKFGFDKVEKLTRDYAAVRNGDLEFVPHPSTWFNQERFNDDPSTWKSNETHKGDNRKSLNRNTGTHNEGKSSDYANAAIRVASKVQGVQNHERSSTGGDAK